MSVSRSFRSPFPIPFEVEDAIVPPVLEFVQQNLQHPTEWRMREAAIMAFGQVRCFELMAQAVAPMRETRSQTGD